MLRKSRKIVAGRGGFVVSMAFLASLASPGSMRGQSVPNVGKGNIEAGIFAGESYGLDRFRPMAGGNVAYGLSPRIFPFVEASYLPGVLREASASNGTVTASERGKFDMTDFHGGVHFRLLRPESRIVPYLVAGLGLIHESAGSLPVCVKNNMTDMTTCAPAQFNFSVPASTVFAVNFGGGLRFFFSEHWALRLEFKAFQPTSDIATLGGSGEKVGDHIFYRFAIGPVFQFR